LSILILILFRAADLLREHFCLNFAFIMSAVLTSAFINFLQAVNNGLNTHNERLQLHVFGRRTTPDKSMRKTPPSRPAGRQNTAMQLVSLRLRSGQASVLSKPAGF
jgi:hypothetical protein